MLYQRKKHTKIVYEKFSTNQYILYPHEGFSNMALGHLPKEKVEETKPEWINQFQMKNEEKIYRKKLQKTLAAIEYGNYCITSSSGCGSTSTILHILKSNDHIIVCDDVYGGTQGYMRKFVRDNYLLQFDFVDMTNIQLFRNLLKQQTKMIWLQTPTNPTMKIIDIDKLVQITKTFNPNIIIVLDNTFATPYLQSPLLLGADISYNSCTKYIGGHSDVVMGSITVKDQSLYHKLRQAHQCLGANSSSMDCELVLVGLQTLRERVIRSTHNAYHIAHYLLKNQNVESVLYPGLSIHPQHEIAKKQMRGFGSMLSFRVKGGRQQASKLMKALKIVTFGESLGGVHTLAKVPFFMNHKVFLDEKIKLPGLTQNLIRLAVGIQYLQDLLEDLTQALEKSQQ